MYKSWLYLEISYVRVRQEGVFLVWVEQAEVLHDDGHQQVEDDVSDDDVEAAEEHDRRHEVATIWKKILSGQQASNLQEWCLLGRVSSWVTLWPTQNACQGSSKYCDDYEGDGYGQCYSNRHCCRMMPERIGGFYKNFSVKLVLNKILIKLDCLQAWQSEDDLCSWTHLFNGTVRLRVIQK